MTYNPTNLHFAALADAQARRTAQAMRLSDDVILTALRNMAPQRAYKLAQRGLSDALARSMKEAHARPVVAE